MKKSICLDMMLQNYSYPERFKVAKENGFDAVEFWKWSNKDIPLTVKLLKEYGLKLSIFNLDCLDEKLSYDLSRGILAKGRKEEFLSAIKESLPVYRELNAEAMIVLFGENAEELTYDEQIENVKTCLKFVKDYLEENDIHLVLEPLNATDRKNYFLTSAKDCLNIIKELNSPNVKMLYDVYHQNMTGDYDLDEVVENLPYIGHFHIADCPGRHEVGTGTVDYKTHIKKTLKAGYSRYYGLEYRATIEDEKTFEFLKDF